MNCKFLLTVLFSCIAFFGCRTNLEQRPENEHTQSNVSHNNIGGTPSIELLHMECVSEDDPNKTCNEINIGVRNKKNLKAGCSVGTINSGGGGFQKNYSIPEEYTEYIIEQWEVRNSCYDLGGPNSILTTSIICGDEKGVIIASCSCKCKNYFP